MARYRLTFRWAVAGVSMLGGACGGPQPLGDAGDPCVRAADCAPGLVCIEGECSDDLSEIGADSDGPGPGPGGSDGAAGAGSGGAPNDVPSSGGAPSGGTSLGGAAGGSG